MNDKSCKTFEKDGGVKLLGQNLLDCHPESSKSELKEMLRKGNTNIYTIEKEGMKKLIYQSPWFVEGQYKGYAEISFEIPYEMRNFMRK